MFEEVSPVQSCRGDLLGRADLVPELPVASDIVMQIRYSLCITVGNQNLVRKTRCHHSSESASSTELYDRLPMDKPGPTQ
mmetsp:Transcript_17378/g.32720  ORF Transcript_17378/g.32720 Transcript_17378/m.32720 type:complete len:80 (+) Transcript_17378:503-742(+)